MTPKERRLEIIAWAPGDCHFDPEDGTFDEVCKMPKRVYQRLIALAAEQDGRHN